MLIKKYQLYRANVFRDQQNPQELIYIVAYNWPSVFSQLYERLGDNIVINSIERLADENINLFIDEGYILDNYSQEPPTVITDIARFGNNY